MIANLALLHWCAAAAVLTDAVLGIYLQLSLQLCSSALRSGGPEKHIFRIRKKHQNENESLICCLMTLCTRRQVRLDILECKAVERTALQRRLEKSETKNFIVC